MKKEIRYKNPNQIFNFTSSAINQALSSFNNNFSNFEIREKISAPLPFIKDNDDFLNEQSPKEESPNFNTFIPKEETNEIAKTEFTPKQTSMEIDFSTPKEEKDFNIIGQFHNTYILVENEDNLEIIDQHIAEERYNYEKLQSEKQVTTQLLFISDVSNVSVLLITGGCSLNRASVLGSLKSKVISLLLLLSLMFDIGPSFL